MSDPFNTASAPLTEPESFVAGSYVAWRRELALDSATYSIKYRFIPTSGGTVFELSGSTDDDNIWLFEALSSVTGTWAAGEYRWDMIVTRLSDSEEALTHTGLIRIFASTEDRRTHAEIMVVKIESLLSGRADSDVENYSIKNRSITKMSVKELTDWRDYYKAEVVRTGGSTTNGNSPKANTIRVRFI